MKPKQKKRLIESSILVLVLALGIVWLMVRPQGSVKYKLPQFSPLAVDDISTITWGTGGQETVLLRKVDGKWLIGEQGYPAAAGRFDTLLKQLSQPDLGDLVTDRGPYQKYQLDEEHRVLLQAHKGETIGRSLLVGKASSGNYSYISLPDQPQVYLLRANISQILETEVDDLRDKQVLSFNADAATKLSIEGPEKTVTINKVSKQGEDGNNVDSWQDETGKEFDLEMVKSTLSNLSSLYASGFRDQQPSGAVYVLTISGDSFSHVLTVASEPVEEGKGYLATVSSYDFPFLIASYTVGSFLEDFGFVDKKDDE